MIASKALLKIATVLGIAFLGTNAANAQAVNAGEVSREIEKTLPSLSRDEIRAFDEEREGRPRFFEDQATDQSEKEILAAPIKRIIISPSPFKKEIRDILQEQALDQYKMSAQDLAKLRQSIWNMGLKHKKLLHTKFRIVPNSKEKGESWLIVDASEIVVRRVRVVSDGSVRQTILDDIKEETSRSFYKEKILDLNELDNEIKNRLRLGDVLLHTSVVPVDDTHVDLKVLVKQVPEKPLSGLVQLDNFGGWSFGRDRLLVGASSRGFLPADEISLIAMKTADVGNADFANGMYFGRAEYRLPISAWGIKYKLWASGLHYHETKAAGTNTDTNGEALELGQGINRAVYTDRETLVDVYADLSLRYTVDRALETERLDEKAEYSGRIGASLLHALENSQMLQLNMSITTGAVDLSGHEQSLSQDQAGPKVNGIFTKFESDGTWSGRIEEVQEMDFKLGAKGQWSPNNLDSIEQFSLGGTTGLRAFGSGEASGDIGFLFSGDVGYTLDYGIRPYVLYDFGAIWRNADPWQSETVPNNYILQDMGLGVTKSFGPVDLSVVFAHQIGPNPGRNASGLDIDNTKQHYRVWASLSYRF